MKKKPSFLKKFLPEPQERSLVGVDLGTSDAKMVELRAKGSGSGYELINFVVEPVISGDKERALKMILSKQKTPGNAPVTAISGKGTLIRHIEVARMSLEELKKSFMFEADKYFPFPPDQIYTDCFILDPKAADNKMSVLVAASKRELVDERIQMLTRLGLQTGYIGINSVAVANVLNVLGWDKLGSEGRKEMDAGGALALMDVGDSVTSLNIVVADLPRFTRDIFIGGRDLTRSLSHGLNMPFDEAEKIKLQPGDRKNEVLSLVDSTVSNLISELRLSFDYFVTEKNIPIERLLIAGGGAMLEGLLEYFASHLEVPVERWDPLEYVELGGEVDEAVVRQQAPRFGVALGLALYA